ncbi:MAG TPA: hypothetical protein VGK27_10920 [Candidatus Deferrimicrobiaceae bacterium]
MTDVRVDSGNLFFFFAYDIGFDIHLGEAATLCRGVESPGLLGSRPAPAHLQYRPKPLLVPLGPVTIAGRSGPLTLDTSAKLFDFGALSVTLSLPAAAMPWDDFVATAIALASDDRLGAAARALAQRLFEVVRPAVARASFADLVEEYALWHVGQFSPSMTGTEALAVLRQDIARLLMLESGRFSAEALPEIVGNPVRYYDNDLFLAEWDAAFVYDPRFRDTLEVIEFLNVQMLELRFFDRLLHGAIDEMGDEIRRKRRLPAILHDPHEKPLRRLSELKLDVTLLRERTDNTLKMVGDAYLARIHDTVRKKAGAERWEATIRDQLGTLEDIYTVINNRAAAGRAETLEAIVIVLILIEIVMGLFRH